jgi:hypothetical protein
VRPLVVVDHVGADHLPGFVEGLELVTPGAALLELAEPGLDERLALGIAVAAATVRDPERGQDGLECAGRERRALSVPSVSMAGAIARSAAACSIRAIASLALQRVCRCEARSRACSSRSRPSDTPSRAWAPRRWSCPDARADRGARRGRTPASRRSSPCGRVGTRRGSFSPPRAARGATPAALPAARRSRPGGRAQPRRRATGNGAHSVPG